MVESFVRRTGPRLKCDGTRAETRFRLSAKPTSPFKSSGASVQLPTGSRGVRINSSYAGYTMFRGFVKGTGYPLHSPVSPSLPLPCVTVCRHVSTGLLPIVCCVCVYRIFHHELVVRCFYMYCTQLLHVSAIYIYMRLSFTQYTSTKLVTLWRWPRKCSDGAAESFHVLFGKRVRDES